MFYSVCVQAVCVYIIRVWREREREEEEGGGGGVGEERRGGGEEGGLTISSTSHLLFLQGDHTPVLRPLLSTHSSSHHCEIHLCIVIGSVVTDKLHIFNNI